MIESDGRLSNHEIDTGREKETPGCLMCYKTDSFTKGRKKERTSLTVQGILGHSVQGAQKG
jgi:hypothetical protein